MSGNPSDAIGKPGEAEGARRFDPDLLQSHVAAIFAGHGLRQEDAARAANALVRADLRGIWSHGVARSSMYCGRLAKKAANPQPRTTLERRAAAAALFDGDDGLGIVVAPRAMAAAIELAKESGVGLVGVKRSGHFGMAGLYAEQAARAGCLGWVFTNASPALPPYGARAAHFGTSPLAFAAPTPEGMPPFLIDMAMSVVARGKLKFSAQRGEPIPEGLALDAEGRPTTDGAAAFSGVVLPFGGVKGAALSWLMDLAGGTFTGAAHAGLAANPFTGTDRPQGTGHLFIAARADLFMPMEDFLERMRESILAAKALPRAEGFEEILTPGEPEARSEAKMRAEGVPLTRDVVEDLTALGESVGVSWPEALKPV